MTESDLRAAHDLLVRHAREHQDNDLKTALHKFAVAKQWEEPTAKEIAAKIRT